MVGPGSAHPLDQAHALLAAGSVDLITSDVFDTIVTRAVATPSDVFVHLGKSLAEAGHLPADVTPSRFAAARIIAERAARQAIVDRVGDEHSPECTLDEIWERMPGHWCADRATMIAAELTNEATHLRPIPAAIDLLAEARRSGVVAALVSDIYLSGDQLAEVLTQCGVDLSGVDRVVTSADRRLGKADGLLAAVIAELGHSPARTMHLGDNDIADIETAARVGATPIHVALHARRRLFRMPSPQLSQASRRIGSDGGLTATTRAVFLANDDHADTPEYQFGIAAAGPALVGFARWVATTGERLGASSIHYLLREGQTIAELTGLVAPDAPTARLVHASRWVDLRAAVIDGTTQELHEALARRGPTTAEHVAAAFDVDADEVRRAWNGNDSHGPLTLRGACAQIAADEELCGRIVDGAARLRERVVLQLRRELDPWVFDAGDEPLVICDVGWGATIQSGLERILRSAGVERRVVGLYLALSAAGEERAALGLDVRSYLPNEVHGGAPDPDGRVVAHHADTVERLLMPESGTFTGVEADGTPITDERIDAHPASLSTAKRAVIDLANEMATFGFDDRVWVDAAAFRSALASQLADAIVVPPPEVARVLVEWPHDDVAGDEARPVGGTETPQLLPYATIRELPMLQKAERSWVEGLAALSNPALAAQLAAARSGVDAELLAPEAPTGPSRLSAFAVGDELACLQVEHHLGVTDDGWSVLRLTGSYPSLRSVRFDAGTEPALVEIKTWTAVVSSEDDRRNVLPIALRSDSIHWVDAWPTVGSRYVELADGHVIAPIDAEFGTAAGQLDVTVVFRRWSLDADDPALQPSVRRRAETTARRVAGAVRRRLPRR